jgi:hypothetical protein
MSMPDPVNPRDNAAVRQFYRDDPTGPSAAEVKESQKPINEVKDVAVDAFDVVASHAFWHQAGDAADYAAERIGGHAAGRVATIANTAFLYFSAIYEGTKTAFELSVDKPAERGEQIGRALLSDQSRFAAAMVVQLDDDKLLPTGYVAAQRDSVVGTGSFNRSPGVLLATRIQADIAAGNPEAIAFRDQLVASVRSGLDAAYLRHIDSPAKLEQLKASDPEFRAQYSGDPGFQLGVRAALWQAQTHPNDFIQAEDQRGVQAATIQLAQGA